MFVADGGISVNKILEPVKEPIRPEMQAYADAKEVGVHEMWQMQLERTEFCKNYLDRWTACEGLDAIICKVYMDSVFFISSNSKHQVQQPLTHRLSMKTSSTSAILAFSTSSTTQLCRSLVV
jgi:hypothetical protein